MSHTLINLYGRLSLKDRCPNQLTSLLPSHQLDSALTRQTCCLQTSHQTQQQAPAGLLAGGVINMWTHCSSKLVCLSNCPVSPLFMSTQSGTILHSSNHAVKVGWLHFYCSFCRLSGGSIGDNRWSLLDTPFMKNAHRYTSKSGDQERQLNVFLFPDQGFLN